MHEQTLKRLEFDKILERLASLCSSEIGQELVFSLKPITDREVILKAQAETTEGKELLRLDPLVDLGSLKDVRREIERAHQGMMLDPQELFNIAQTLKVLGRCRKFLLERRERYPLLSEVGFAIGNFNILEKKISSAILPSLEVSDTASPALAGIRRKLSRLMQQVKEQLENITRQRTYQKYLQEPLVTIREGRYVVPVKQEFRNQIPGLIHDQSASGATVFIEPMAVVEANNEIRRLKVAEKQEIDRILTELTKEVAKVSKELKVALLAFGRLDFILAKARYSQTLDARKPLIVPGKAFLDFKKARHPLLSGNIVPIDVHLGRNFDILIITGPNTGGKTVGLKTVGLLVLMAQAGLHIPVENDSQMGVFENVFVDIGDEQSIEQNLSTFSSHISNIVNILQNANLYSLILLDELGAGTDPVEGAAFAQAILDDLENLGAKTIATTHFSELKSFAQSRKRVENACVEFDALTLKPTYRLLIGRPGMSQAFEIALRLGIEPGLVRKARKFLTKEQGRVLELIEQLERNRQEQEREKEEIKRLHEEARAIKRRYEEMEKQLITRRQKMLSEAYEEAERLLRQTRREAQEIINQFRAQFVEESARAREKAISELRQKIQVISKNIKDKTPQEVLPEGEAPDAPDNVAVGQEVYLFKYNQRGYVVAPVEDGNVQVQVGAIKIIVPLKELRIITRKTSFNQIRVTHIVSEKIKEISPRLDLRGLRTEEALLRVEKYLDDAELAGLSRVCLIHGKGTGALRAAIQQKLKGDRRVKSFRLGEHSEGGTGVTVVDLT